MVYNLSTNPKAPVRGWCSASQPMIGKALGVSRQSINTMIKKLALSAILIKSESGKLLKSGDLWIDTVVNFKFNSKDSLHTVKKVDSKESLHHVKKVDTQQSRKLTVSSKESLHNSNIDNYTNNNINKKSVDKPTLPSSKKEIKPKIKKEVAATSQCF
jgi:biotin operon repressor